MSRVAVVGGGLTGLSAAWRLQSAGCQVKVFEKASSVGGRTLSIRQNGFVFDVGAITLLPTYTKICALVAELGLGAHLHRVDPVIGIPREGRIHRLEVRHAISSLLRTPLVSARAKLRLLKLVWPLARTWKLSTYESLSTLADWDGETIADFARRELGDEVHDYIVTPIIRGNTLNGTDSAPAGELLWMLRQYAAPYLYAFDQGINFLAEALGARVPVALGSEVTTIVTAGNGVVVEGKNGAGSFRETYDACIVGLPPRELLALAPRLSQRQRAFLESVKPLVSLSVHVGLSRRPPIVETFILPPVSEQPVLTTIVMDHLKAPGRAPAGKGVASFFVRDTWGAANLGRPDREILDEVLAMARPFVGDLRADVETFVVQRWPYAIIKSERGLYHRMRDYEADVDAGSRIQLGGDFLSLGMEAAVSSGTTMAGRVRTLLG